jgi:hypothetical protein
MKLGSFEPEFYVIAEGQASPARQVQYLSSVLKVKNDEIRTLRLELETAEINRSLEAARMQKRLEAMLEVNQHMKEKAPRDRISVETLERMSTRKLPWWKRVLKRKAHS